MLLHVLIWQLAGREPVKAIDHENGQPLDNRLVNLRKANASQNGANRPAQRNNTSGLKGVAWIEGRRQKHRAAIQVNTKTIFLGYFDRQEDAQHAYDLAAVKYFGAFAWLNPPTDPSLSPEEYRAILSCFP